MRSDRREEFTSNEFYNYCKSQGIQRQLTTSYTPQQNGIIKKKNITIVEMARSMLKVKSLPKKFWSEAITCAVFLLNRYSTKTVFGRTPEEVSHIPKEHRKKFVDTSEKCIFISYSDITKGYKLSNPETGKLIVSRDVQLLENESWTWTQTQSEQKTIVSKEDFEIQKDSTIDISTSNTPIKSSTMQTKTK